MKEDSMSKGITCMLISALAFTFMSVFVRLAGDLPTFEKVFFRNSVSMVVALGMIVKLRGTGVKLFGHQKNQPLLLVRSLLGVSGVALNFWAIKYLVLADSTMLSKISPFFVTIFAVIFLKEKLSKFQIPALFIVFFSALLIIKPQFDAAVLPALAGFLGAAAAGGAYTIIRSLKGKEEPATIIFYFSFFSVVTSFPIMIAQGFIVPSYEQLFYLLMIGISASFGQFGITMAYKYAPAAEVSIYNYSSIIFAILIGFLFWGEIPDGWSILGGCIIIGTALSLFIYNHRKRTVI
ncbi:MAG: DMT family transporter [Lentisphaeria bacterium]|nr:DMT family transporter [Lentisphaeria bacterium]